MPVDARGDAADLPLEIRAEALRLARLVRYRSREYGRLSDACRSSWHDLEQLADAHPDVWRFLLLDAF